MIPVLTICALGTLAGLGMLYALRVRLPAAAMWLTAPCVGLSLWAIMLGVGISAGFSGRVLAPFFWIITAAFAAVGIRAASIRSGPAVPWILLTAAFAAPLILLAADISHGLENYVGNPSGDGWSYVAYGQYLWELPKGTQGHLAPLLQYATHLNRTRFISAGLLGMFSPVTGSPGDTQTSVGCFIAWDLFAFGSAVAAAGALFRLSRASCIGLIGLVVVSPWVLGAIEVHNYDNLVALSFLPAVTALIGLAAPSGLPVGAITGLLLAASIYSYAELAAFVVLGAVIAIGQRASVERSWRFGTATLATAALVAIAPVWPGRDDLLWFMTNQIGAAQSAVGSRAGEGYFLRLLERRAWPSVLWGLAVPAQVREGSFLEPFEQVVASALTLVTAIGVAAWLVLKRWDSMTMAAILAGAAVAALVHAHYAYAGYKFLLFAWWYLAAATIVGAGALTRWATSRPSVVRLATIGGAVVAGLVFAVSMAADLVAYRQSLSVASLENYRRLLEVTSVIHDDPIIVDVDDALANEWAVYFLRKQHIRLMGYRAYMAMAHVVPLMEQADTGSLESTHYVLTDAASRGTHDVAWADGPYVLYRIPPAGAAFLGHVSNPNGNEQVGGRPFFWIGAGETRFDVVATRDGVMVLSARFIAGPSLPQTPERHLELRSDAAIVTATLTGDAEQSLSLLVHAGTNTIRLRELDVPTATNPADPRPLLLGMSNPTLTMK